jgi:hypothetical protein
VATRLTPPRLTVRPQRDAKAVAFLLALLAVALLGGCTSKSGAEGPQAMASGLAPTPQLSHISAQSRVTTDPSGPIAKVLSLRGPITSAKAGRVTYLPGGAWAATSLTALRAGIPAEKTKSCSNLCWPDAVQPVGPTIYIAGPLRIFTCEMLRSVHVNFTDPTTAVVESTVANQCPKGVSQTISGLTLIAVPRSALPNVALLRILVVDGSARVPPFLVALRLS